MQRTLTVFRMMAAVLPRMDIQTHDFQNINLFTSLCSPQTHACTLALKAPQGIVARAVLSLMQQCYCSFLPWQKLHYYCILLLHGVWQSDIVTVNPIHPEGNC